MTGFAPLLGVALRSEWRRVLPWAAFVCLLSVSSVLAYDVSFPTAADRARLAATLGTNPALSLLLGPARELGTADGFNAWRAGQLGALLSALMAVLVVVRTSRAQEDSGQLELVASGAVARSAPLAVAVAVGALASLALGVLCGTATILAGGAPGSTLVLCAGFVVTGLVFGALAAVTAQVGAESRTATTLAVAVVAVAYALRGYLDFSDAPAWTSWLTPFGWVERAAPAAADDPRPLLAGVVVAALLVALAFVLRAGRDHGRGLVAGRPGRQRAGLAGSVPGLALRLEATTLLAWTLGLVGFGALFGTVVPSLADVVADNPALAELLAASGGAAVDAGAAFVVTLLQVLAVLAAVMGAQVALRVHGEEEAGRVEPLLAGSARRATVLASYAAPALLAPALAFVAGGASLGLVATSQGFDLDGADLAWQLLATVPAVWVLVGVGVAAVGAVPRLRLLAWVGIAATFVLALLGPTLDLPRRVLDLSPLAQVPQVLLGEEDLGGLVALLVATVLLLAVGFVGYRRRDVG